MYPSSMDRGSFSWIEDPRYLTDVCPPLIPTALQSAGMQPGHGFDSPGGPPKSPMDGFDGGRTMLLGKRPASPSGLSPAGSPLEDPGKRSRPPTLRLLKDEPVPDGYVRYRQVKKRSEFQRLGELNERFGGKCLSSCMVFVVAGLTRTAGTAIAGTGNTRRTSIARGKIVAIPFATRPGLSNTRHGTNAWTR